VSFIITYCTYSNYIGQERLVFLCLACYCGIYITSVLHTARFPGTACQSGDLNGCRDGEMCVKTAGSGSNYVCVCMRDYVYSFGRQMCVKEQHIFNESIPYFDGKTLVLYLLNVLLAFRTV
jgi:hypothetical protein